MDQTVLSLADIQNMDRRYRATLLNTLSGFKSANLVGSTRQTRKPQPRRVQFGYTPGRQSPAFGHDPETYQCSSAHL